MNLAELAKKLGCELEGDAGLEITGVAGIEEAQPGELTFLVNRKYRPALEKTRASAILVARDAGPMRIAALRSRNPYLDFARAIEFFHPQPEYPPGIHPTAVVAKSAELGSGAHIGPYCYVDEDVRIGKNAVLHSFVTIYRGANDRRRLFRPFPCHRSRRMPDRQPRASSEWSRRGKRWLWVRPATQWKLVQDAAIGGRSHRRRRGNPGQCRHRSRDRGRNPYRPRHQDRQSGPGRSRLQDR